MHWQLSLINSSVRVALKFLMIHSYFITIIGLLKKVTISIAIDFEIFKAPLLRRKSIHIDAKKHDSNFLQFNVKLS